MPYVAVLDACVLHPISMCDTLLRLADAGFFRAVWSDEILIELERSLLRRGLPPERARRRRGVMEESFPEADQPGWERFIPLVPTGVDPKDRHVVAVAIASHANVIVTSNVRDFAAQALTEFDIAVQHPDEFLVHQLGLDARALLRVLGEQAGEMNRPPMTVDELLARFEQLAPEFVKLVRRELANEEHHRGIV